MTDEVFPDRESVRVLQEAIGVQRKKSNDYQNPMSTVVQADFYPSGILTIYEIMWGKMLRMKSLMESGADPNFESLEDSAIDLINYSSFYVSWLRGKVPGQDPSRDAFNKPKPLEKSI